MDKLSAQVKLMGNMQEIHTVLLNDVLTERGRSFASDREAWAQLKENIENAESQLKAIKELHKDMWAAVKEQNEDAFYALACEFQRLAQQLARQWTTTGVLANIALLGDWRPETEESSAK